MYNTIQYLNNILNPPRLPFTNQVIRLFPHYWQFVVMSSSNSPRRIAQIIRLKPESLQAYKDCHKAAWPAVLKQIKDCNIIDYSIFLDEESMILFASFKYTGSDFDADMENMRANPEVRKWWQMTDSMQESLVEGATGSTGQKPWWKNLEEVFRFE